MKISLLFLILAVAGVKSHAQSSSSDTQVKSAIMAFADATANQDVDQLEKLLDTSFRVTMNRMFGSSGVLIMDRTSYLGKIKAKEFGGETREVTIHELDINGNLAMAKVKFAGEMTFTSYLLFAQGVDGQWRLVSDLPAMG
ncbi:MAG: nuclear transport factor 2 family protein [Cyclobacteriaceae bacterium]